MNNNDNIQPSEEQLKIFDFIKNGIGHCVIQARAGTGKTWTILKCLDYIKDNQICLYLAFNFNIKLEIQSKINNKHDVFTLHGLGREILKQNYIIINRNDDKYKKYLIENIDSLSNIKVPQNLQQSYFRRILTLLEFARMDLCYNLNKITQSAKEHDIPVKFDEIEIVKKLMDWGQNEIYTQDYTDWVWLPNVLNLQPKPKYQWIFNDEAQDYSIAYVSLLKKYLKNGVRFVSVGDEYQSINHFAGASKKAFGEMIKLSKNNIFTLTKSFRCAKSIIELANEIVPDIVPRDNAPLGLIKYGSLVHEIKKDDMVLSRTNAPLLSIYNKLTKLNKKCYIKGSNKDKDKDIFIHIIEKYRNNNNSLSKNLETDGLFPRLYEELINRRNQLLLSGISEKKLLKENYFSSFYDKILSLLTISEDCETVDNLINKINEIYQSKEEGVCLSTIHKAKGLECDIVHIMNFDELGTKFVHNEIDREQEKNLKYVAITRAKKKLCLISEKEYPNFISSTIKQEIEKIDEIEKTICDLFNKKVFDKSKIETFDYTPINEFKTIHDNDNVKKITISKPKNLSNNKNSLFKKRGT